MTETETTDEYVERRRREADEAARERDEFDAEVAAEYARMRAADKAAGRDTSGKSVHARQTVAFDVVMMRRAAARS